VADGTADGAWRFTARLQRRLGRLVARLAGVRVTGLEQLPARGPYVVVAPHVSLLDPVLLYVALPRPARFVTAAYLLAGSRLLGAILREARVVPVHREHPDPPAVRAALRALAAGEVLAFFPEGGRSWTGVPGRPMAAASKLLAGLEVPVFVAVLEGAYASWPRWCGWPRPRRLGVRVVGPLQLPPRPPARPPRPGGRARWWTAVFAPARPAHVAACETAILDAFRTVARDEPARLSLRGAGRQRALTTLLGFCPACAGPPLQRARGRLGCPACGAAWAVRDGAWLAPARPTHGGPPAPASSLDVLFRRMASRLEARAREGLRLDLPVTVVEEARGATPSGPRPALASLGPDGLRLLGGPPELRVPLAAFARAQIAGTDTLELPLAGCRTLRLVGRGAALRLLLLGRAHLGLPLDTMTL
jgi:1-acyl-sn-glycerol-3-phosphate acyltransferase